jgi:hypothetical protein
VGCCVSVALEDFARTSMQIEAAQEMRQFAGIKRMRAQKSTQTIRNAHFNLLFTTFHPYGEATW